MSSENEDGIAKFTDAVASSDYPSEDKKDPTKSESENKELNKFLDQNKPPELQTLFNSLSDEKALDVKTIGLSKEIIFDGNKYQRNVLTAKRRDEWVKLEEKLARARYTSSYVSVEWQVVKEKVKLIWNIQVNENSDSEMLYRIVDATDIVIGNRFRPK